jgi:hypothetical protein
MHMNEMVKLLAERLHGHYERILREPMPWRMIDALASVEEMLEAREEGRATPARNGHVYTLHNGHCADKFVDLPSRLRR